MTGPERDDEFETYLKERSLLHERLQGLDRPEPPEELDRIVLKKARQAIRSSPQAPVFRAPRWALPVALAAILLLSFAVVLNFSLQPRKPQNTASLPPTAAPLSAAPAPPPNAEPAAPTPLLAQADVRAKDASGPTRELPKAHAQPEAPVQTPTPGYVASARPAQGALAQDAAAQGGRTQSNSPSVVNAPALGGARQSSKAFAPESRAAAQSPGPASSADTKPSVHVDTEALARAERPADAVTPARTTTAPAEAASASETTSASRSTSASQAAANAPQTTDAAKPVADATGSASASVSTLEEVVTTGSRVTRAHSKAPRDPAEWLRHIDELRAHGKTAEADRELKRFHAAYPNYQAPAAPSSPATAPDRAPPEPQR